MTAEPLAGDDNDNDNNGELATFSQSMCKKVRVTFPFFLKKSSL